MIRSVPRGWFAAAIYFLILTFAFAPSVGAQAKDKKKGDKKNDKKDEKKDDKKSEAKRSAERIRQYLKQLHARFDAWDADNDNKINARELALVFRGPKAEPLDRLKVPLPTPDPIAPPTYVVETIPGKVPAISLALLTWPAPGLPSNAALAELLSTKPKEVTKVVAPPPMKVAPPPKLPDFTRFPDYQFLMLSGKGKDWTVSRAEFDAFAKNYAHLLDRLEEAEHDVSQAKNKLAKASGAKAKAAAQQDLKQANAELTRVQSQWNAIPLAVHQALKIKH